MATAVAPQMHSKVQEFVGKPRKMFINQVGRFGFRQDVSCL